MTTNFAMAAIVPEPSPLAQSNQRANDVIE